MTLEREDSGGQERDEESDDQMEEDEGFASNAGKAPKVPLKRGTACLRCRTRKLRCDAAKPACVQCTKASKPCEYDNGKPKSRVKVLEAKIAALEQRLTSGPQTAPTSEPSFNAFAGPSQSVPTTYAHPPFHTGFNWAEMMRSTANNGTSNIPPPLHHSRSSESSTQSRGNRFGEVSGGAQSRRESEQSNGNHGRAQVEDVAEFQMELDVTGFSDPFLTSQQQPSPFVTNNPYTIGGMGNPQGAHISAGAMPTNAVSSTTTGYNSQSVNDIFGDLGPLTADTQNLLQSILNGGNAEQPFDTSFGGHIATTEAPPVETSTLGYGDGNKASPHHPWTNILKGTGNISAAQSPPGGIDFASLDPSMVDLVAQLSGINEPPTSNINSPSQCNPSHSASPDNYDASNPTYTQWKGSYPHIQTQASPEEVGRGFASSADAFQVSGGWYDSTDLPQAVRDRLLDLFFQKANVYFLEVSIERFKARLLLEPKKRPHPCWLYAMYLMATRHSEDASLRNLEKHFYTVATEQYEKAVEQNDRLLDAIRGSQLITGYQYGRGQYLQGYIWTGRCVRLATACGLHKIPSTSFREYLDSNGPGGGRQQEEIAYKPRVERYWALPPPTDPIDLGERIAAFWSVFSMDRLGATAMRWVPCLPIDQCTTPFPHELWAYAKPDVSTANDQTVHDLLDSKKNKAMIGNHVELYMIKIVALLHETTHLITLQSADGSDQMPEHATPGSRSASDAVNAGCPKERKPVEHDRLTRALQAFIDSLPPQLREPVARVGSEIHVDVHVITLHFYINVIIMWLHDMDDWQAENVEACRAARRILTLARVIPEEKMPLIDIYACMLLTWAGRVLIKELRRMVFNGDFMGAVSVEMDLDAMVTIIGKMGRDLKLAEMQAMRFKDWRRTSGGTAELLMRTAERGVNPDLMK